MLRRSRANKRRATRRFASGQAWKMERASIGGGRKGRARSNKFSGGDSDKKPRAHSRKGEWVGGYTKRDGTNVKGYFRTNAQYSWRR